MLTVIDCQGDYGGKSVKHPMKPLVLSSNQELVFNTLLVDQKHSMAHVPYPYTDPYLGGLFSTYGPQAINQAQMGSHLLGIAPARVPLPVDLTEDGPIYVNPKQYHGILRRRQSRAKLEAQNKLVKNRKPYLHESRHLHALNRLRGSGGRFLSAKKNQQCDPAAGKTDSIDQRQRKNSSDHDSHDSGTGEYSATTATCSDITSASNGGSVIFRQSDNLFAGITPHMNGIMQLRGGIMHGGSQNCASVVR